MNNYSYRKTYIYTGLAVLLPAVLYVTALFLLQRERLATEKAETAKILRADTQNFRIGLDRALADSLADRARLEAHFVRKDGIVDFINGLEKLGFDSRVKANISSLGESWQDEKGGTLSLSLHVIGTFADVYRYLTLLEEVPQKLVLDEVIFTAGESGSAPASLKAMAPHVITWTSDIRATVRHYVK